MHSYLVYWIKSATTLESAENKHKPALENMFGKKYTAYLFSVRHQIKQIQNLTISKHKHNSLCSLSTTSELRIILRLHVANQQSTDNCRLSITLSVQLCVQHDDNWVWCNTLHGPLSSTQTCYRKCDWQWLSCILNTCWNTNCMKPNTYVIQYGWTLNATLLVFGYISWMKFNAPRPDQKAI